MYTEAVQDAFAEHGIEEGDPIRVTTPDGAWEGILMPRSQQGDRSVVVIKLDNGYNLGIRYTDDTELEKIEDQDTAEEQDITIPEPDPDKQDIAILHTGGTIASRVSYEEGGVKPAFEPADLLQLYPELFDRANVASEVIAQMLSEDMEPPHWVEIAEAVADHRDRDGIIIGHGTDTIQYTAAALSYMLENIDVPVVIVGAQRSSDRPSSDAAMNLLSAVSFIEEGVPGVYVCMHDAMSDDTAAVHRGTRVRKMHTSRRDTFRSIGTPPVARVSYPDGAVEMLQDVQEPEDGFALRTDINENVGLLKARPGMDPHLLDAYTGKDGVVIEGTGLGHIPVSSFDEHTQHHEATLENLKMLSEDAVVAMSSQCVNGRVNMNVYDAGVKIQNAGVVSAERMTPAAAYVKLMWALGQADSRADAIDLFQTDVAGELPEREEHDGF